MKKKQKKKKLEKIFLEDSYLNVLTYKDESIIEHENEINELLEDYNIEDLDLSKLDDENFDEALFL